MQTRNASETVMFQAAPTGTPGADSEAWERAHLDSLEVTPGQDADAEARRYIADVRRQSGWLGDFRYKTTAPGSRWVYVRC